jgi:hypothetical protein
MTNKPNFLIVGAAKCGSTSLYQFLNQHPQVYMPANKEPNYFVADYQKTMSRECPSYNIDMKRMVFDKGQYYDLFNGVNNTHKAIGEASVTYLYKPEFSIPNIKKELGDPKIIIILRNPIKRAFSHYSYACELGLEKLNFEDAITTEEKRLKDNWSSTFSYIGQGMFYCQVKAFMLAFTNVHIVILDDFVKNQQEELKEVYKFLNIDQDFKNSFIENFNTSGIPRFSLLQKYLVHDNFLKSAIKQLTTNFISDEKLRKFARKVRKINQGGKLVLSNEQRQQLVEIYGNDITALSKLIGVDLSYWSKW